MSNVSLLSLLKRGCSVKLDGNWNSVSLERFFKISKVCRQTAVQWVSLLELPVTVVAKNKINVKLIINQRNAHAYLYCFLSFTVDAIDNFLLH